MRWRQTREPCNGGGGGVTSEVGNVTSSGVPVVPVSVGDCASYQLCVRRRLLYHCVVLLGPTVCVTVVLLTLLITSPSLTVKVPADMSVVIVSCLLLEFICSMTPPGVLSIIG